MGVEAISDFTIATEFTSATEENTVRGLKEWFSTLPLPKKIQTDNGTHFMATVVREWAKEEGI